jgi:hypothetical protein
MKLTNRTIIYQDKQLHVKRYSHNQNWDVLPAQHKTIMKVLRYISKKYEWDGIGGRVRDVKDLYDQYFYLKRNDAFYFLYQGIWMADGTKQITLEIDGNLTMNDHNDLDEICTILDYELDEKQKIFNRFDL